MKGLLIPFLLLFVPVVMVVKQPDLGTGLVTMAIGGSLILFAGLTNMTLFAILGGGVAGSIVVWKFLLKTYQRQRIYTFLDPEGDALGKGYHAIQSLIAVGSGKMWGKGWGNGTQNQLQFLPEQHTDFAYPVWAEEHGFVGSAILVVLFLFLVLSALDVASRARDRFGAYLAFGAAALFFWHAFINIGMVIGVLPVVGVPLLLVSYGGSSAVLTMLSIGVLLNVAVRRTQFQ
jgi:rod shape determining protein RodA